MKVGKKKGETGTKFSRIKFEFTWTYGGQWSYTAGVPGKITRKEITKVRNFEKKTLNSQESVFFYEN